MARPVDTEGKKFVRSFNLTQSIMDGLNRLAIQEDRSVNWLVRRALEEYVKANHKPERKGKP